MKKLGFILLALFCLSFNSFSQTLLELAKDNKTDEVIKLINNGQKDIPDDNGWNALLWACYNENAKLVQFLIDTGSDVCTFHKISLNYPLIMAARVNKGSEIVEILLRTKAKTQINTYGHDGFTPIIAAAKNNNIEICKLLLSAGADKSIKSKEGYLPWEHSSIEEIQNLLKP